MTRDDEIRALVIAMETMMGGVRVDICAAALSTVAGRLCFNLTGTEKDASGALDALAGDAREVITRMAAHTATTH